MASDPTPDPLDARIATALVRIGQAVRAKSWGGAVAQGVTPTQGQILLLLASRRGGMRLAAIAEALGLTAATTSETVSTLERKGLVLKARDAADTRALSVMLTTEGQDAAGRSAQWPDFLGGAVALLPETDKRALLRSLITIIRGLQEQGHISVARMCVTCRHFEPNRHPGEDRPHHCTLVDAPLGLDNLRLDCPEHAQEEPAALQRRWLVLAEA